MSEASSYQKQSTDLPELKTKSSSPCSLLGICFAFAILATQIGFSAAIGAFIIGVVVARSYHREEINKQIGPFKIVFGAIFFVSMGALMDITQIANYWIPAVIITLAVLVPSWLAAGLEHACSVMTEKLRCVSGLGWLKSANLRSSWVKPGRTLGVTSNFLLPIIGVATIITAFVTPYLIKFSFKSKDETDEGFSHI